MLAARDMCVWTAIAACAVIARNHGWGAAHSGAAIVITKSNGAPVPDGSATVTFNPKTGGWNVQLLQLYLQWGDTVFEIHGNGGETIDTIVSAVNGPPAGSPVIIRVLSDAPGGVLTVHNIIQTGNAETLLNRVQVLEDIGSVQIQAMGDMIAGRDVLGPLVATTPDNASRGITTVQAGRHILGNLSAEFGRIGAIVAQGNVGAENAPITIRAKHRVGHVVGVEVFADVNSRVNGGSGGLARIEADRFIGTVQTDQIVASPALNVNGFILVREQFLGSITIGKSFNDPLQWMEFPVQGLTGQVIINADNVAGGVWTSPIRVGPTGHPQQIVLTGPNYAADAAALGGGGVGLAPFSLHDEACAPANGEVVQMPPNAPPATVDLRHYGPVTWAGTPVAIERKLAGSAGPYTTVSASNFSITSPPNDPRVVRIASIPGFDGFAPGFEYRIVPTSQLRSAVAAQPPVVWQAPYTTTLLTPPCDGDIDINGTVNVTDLLFVITFWGPTPTVFPAVDVNSDGMVNVSDLLIVISNWGACW